MCFTPAHGETDKNISDLGLKNSSAVLHPKGTVVLSRDAGVGKSAILAEDMAVSQHFMAWQCKEDLDNYYLYYWLQLVKPEFERIAVGSTIKTIGLPFFKKIKIFYPALSEQVAIRNILLSCDKRISIIEKTIANKRQYKRALMQRLVTGKLRFPKFIGQPLHIKQLGDFIEEVTDRNKTQSITRVLSVTNHSGFVLPEERFSRRVASENVSNYKIVRNGQFAYNPSRINVGSLARLQQYDEGILSPMYVIFKHDSATLDSEFLWQWLNSEEAKKRIVASTQGSVRDSVGYNTLASFSLKIPTLPEQREIAAVLCAADREIDQLKQKLEAYKQQKKGLMQQLLTGKKRINLGKKEAA